MDNSLIERYKTVRGHHKKSLDIIERSVKPGNSNRVHYARLVDKIYHVVAFSFNSKSGSRHDYESHPRLAEYIGKACEEMKNDIFDRACELSKEDVDSNKEAARHEAEEVLNFIKKNNTD